MEPGIKSPDQSGLCATSGGSVLDSNLAQEAKEDGQNLCIVNAASDMCNKADAATDMCPTENAANNMCDTENAASNVPCCKFSQ